MVGVTNLKSGGRYEPTDKAQSRGLSGTHTHEVT